MARIPALYVGHPAVPPGAAPGPAIADQTSIRALRRRSPTLAAQLGELVVPPFPRFLDALLLPLPQIDAPDLARDGLGQLVELQPPDPLERRQVLAGVPQDLQRRL